MTLAVLSFGIILVLSSIHNSLAISRKSDNYYEAVSRLESKLFELKTKGEISMDDSDIFKYRYSKTAVNGLPIEKVRLSVYWLEKGMEKEVWVNTYLEKKIS